MKTLSDIRARYMRDPLPVRWAGWPPPWHASPHSLGTWPISMLWQT